MSNVQTVPVVGLIGGVGSGKSSVARWLSERDAVFVVDGDQAGHEVLKVPAVKEQIRKRFGNSVFDQKGELVRAALGRLVFGADESSRAARRDLENIVHPGIRDILQRRIAGAPASARAILVDAAVLLEAGWDDLCHAVVFVEANERQRLERVAASRGWSEQDLRTREASQWLLDVKRHAADYVIDNSRTVDECGRELRELISDAQRKLAGTVK